MATYKHLRSSTANKRPTTSIADGQLALNTNATSPGLFFKDSTGATIIKIGPVHVGTTAPNATPGAGGSSGNSTGEVWLDTSITPVGVKIWNGSAWVNGTPTGSTTVQGLLELATDVETQSGSDAARAVTPAGLQSKVSDSISTTSSTTIASSTAVKAAYDLAAAGLPRSGGTVTGNLEIGTTGSLTFEGSVADGFETALAVTNPTADRVITLPDISGTVVTTGDTGSVTSAMIANGTIISGDIASGTIVDSNISASAEIAVSKLADGAAGQIIQTDSAGTGVEWSDTANLPLGSAAAPAYRFQGDANTGIYSPGADQVAISTNGTRQLSIDASGNVNIGNDTIYVDAVIKRAGIGTTSPVYTLDVNAAAATASLKSTTGTSFSYLNFNNTGGNSYVGVESSTGGNFSAGTGAYALCLAHMGAYPICFATNSQERARIDSSGRLLVGTSSGYVTSTSATTQPLLQIHSTNTHEAQVSINSWATGTATGANLSLCRSDSGTVGTHTAVGSTDVLGTIRFSGSDGDQFIEGASIAASADGTWGDNDGPTKLVFSTTADGAFSPTERLCIGSDGKVGINATPAVGQLDITIDNATAYSSANMFDGGLAQYLYNTSATDGTAVTIGFGVDGTSTDAQAAISAIYSSAATGNLAFGTRSGGNVVERMRLTSTGLGLGTSSPAPAIGNGATLHLYGASTTSELRLQRGNGTDLSLLAGSTAGGAAISLNNKFSISTDSNSTQAFTVDTSGRVGIGVTSPATTLDVNGDVTIADKIIHGGDTNTAIRFPAADTVSVETAGNERARIDSSGRLLVGTVSDSGGALLQVNGNRVRVATAKTPASASDTGTTGEICWDANYVYVCTATNTWKRTAISTW